MPALRAALGALGDSLVVVGGDGLWNVHVHVDDVGAAIEAGIEAGRPYRVVVTHFAEQVAAAAATHAPRGPGGARDRRRAGARRRCSPRPGARWSSPSERAALLDRRAARPRCSTSGADEVVVLPNDRHGARGRRGGRRARRASAGVRVAVIPTRAQVQGLAALAVHDPAAASTTTSCR